MSSSCMSRFVAPLCLLLLASTSACTHRQLVQDLRPKLAEVPDGYVEGEVGALEAPQVIENKDFVYAIALSPKGTHAAYTHLAGKNFNLGVWGVETTPAQKVTDRSINAYEFDVEGLDFSPDGNVIVSAGRDGVVRFFSAKDGQLLAQYFGDDPLVSVMFHPNGKLVLAGASTGNILALDWPSATFVSETQAHRDEIRALAATPDGRVVSGSWDKTIAVWEVAEQPLNVNEVSLFVGVIERNIPVVRVGLDGKTGIFAFDANQPHVVVSSELARSAGIQPTLLTETAQVDKHSGRLARGRTITMKHVTVPDVDIVVCDACLPKGAHGILGKPVLERFEAKPNPVTGTLLMIAKEKADSAASPAASTLKELKRHTFPSYVNDLTIDRAGARLGVAFSHEKAERNQEVYHREKKGEEAQVHVADIAAIVEVDTGKVHKEWHRHRGVVSTVGISPDGRNLATGGWDKRLYLYAEESSRPVQQVDFGWTLRRVRFSRDGLSLAVGAWTPQNAVGNLESDPAAVVYLVGYTQAEVRPAPKGIEVDAVPLPEPQPELPGVPETPLDVPERSVPGKPGEEKAPPPVSVPPSAMQTPAS